MKALYVSSRDLAEPVRLARRPITEVMSKPAAIISADAVLDEALVRMVRSGVRHLAAVDEAGRCVGVISDRAIAAAWAADYSSLSHQTVAAALDREPAMVSMRDAVVDAARLMDTSGADAVAVVDDHARPVGMVTGRRFVSLLAR